MKKEATGLRNFLGMFDSLGSPGCYCFTLVWCSHPVGHRRHGWASYIGFSHGDETSHDRFAGFCVRPTTRPQSPGAAIMHDLQGRHLLPATCCTSAIAPQGSTTCHC